MKKPLSNPLRTSLGSALIIANAWAFSGMAHAVGETVSLGSKAGDQNAYASTGWPSLSADGRYTTLTAAANFIQHIFLYDRFTKTTKNLTATGNSASFTADISANGRFMAFRSAANNLVANDGNGFTADIFVQNIQTGKNELVSKAFDGTSANDMSYFSAISADGQYVAFTSAASNLVANDGNHYADVFVRNRKTGKTTRASVSSAGTEAVTGVGSSGLVDISGDGRYVVFSSGSNNLVAGDDTTEDVFLHDTKNKTTTKISQAVRSTGFSGGSKTPSISADGRYIAFLSGSSQLLANDTDDFNADVFVYDRVGKKMSKITNNATGSSVYPVISADGRFVSFMSQADNLVLNDTNGAWDTFIHDRKTAKTSRINLTPQGQQSLGDKQLLQARPSLSADGRFVGFESAAKDLAADDTDSAATDVFLRDTLLNKQKTADVALAVSAPTNALQGQTYAYKFTVSNKGTAIASQPNAIINLPTSLTINSVVPSQGSCVKGMVTVCRLGGIGVGLSATIQVNVTPSVKGGISVSATAGSVEKDTVYTNNAVTKALTVN